MGAGLNRLAYRTHDRPALRRPAQPDIMKAWSDGTKKPHDAASAVRIREANPVLSNASTIRLALGFVFVKYGSRN